MPGYNRRIMRFTFMGQGSGERCKCCGVWTMKGEVERVGGIKDSMSASYCSSTD